MLKNKVIIIFTLLLLSQLQTLRAGNTMQSEPVDTVAIIEETAEELFEPLCEPERSEAIENIINRHTPWQKLLLNGKLRDAGLPLSVSLRIYMENAKRILLSARAPFVGEALRIDLSCDSIIIINKMKKTYCRESAEGLLDFYPGAIADFQSLLLARLVVPGEGELSQENRGLIEIGQGEDGYIILPKADDNPSALFFAYRTDAEGRLSSQTLAIKDKELSINYSYSRNGAYVMRLLLSGLRRDIRATLDFDTPAPFATMPAPASITNKYRRVSIGEVLKF